MQVSTARHCSQHWPPPGAGKGPYSGGFGGAWAMALETPPAPRSANKSRVVRHVNRIMEHSLRPPLWLPSSRVSAMQRSRNHCRHGTAAAWQHVRAPSGWQRMRPLALDHELHPRPYLRPAAVCHIRIVRSCTATSFGFCTAHWLTSIGSSLHSAPRAECGGRAAIAGVMATKTARIWIRSYFMVTQPRSRQTSSTIANLRRAMQTCTSLT